MSHPTTTLALLDALQEKWHQRFMALSAKDSEKRVGQAVSEAANDLGDIIEAYESERLASDEPADQIRTLPEAISSRIVIPHASFSFEMTSDGISPDLYATLTGHPVAVEDDDAVPQYAYDLPEPGRYVGTGSMQDPLDVEVAGDRLLLHCPDGDVIDHTNLWRNRGCWTLTPVEPARADYVGGECAECGVPSNGHAVDCMRFDEDAEPAPAGERRVNVTITDVYAVPGDYGFLRINVGPETAVIDQNASNVTVTDVEPAPADVDPDEAGGEGGPEPKAELDEVEALAMDLFHASLKIPPASEIGMTEWSSERERSRWTDVARAAREHIEDSLKVYYRDLYDKAESDLARVTKERDRLTHLLGSHADGHRCTCEMTDPGKPGIEPPTWEQDPWCLTHPDMAVIVAEVKTLKAKADRYDALRADVESLREAWKIPSILSHAVPHLALGQALDRDTERAES